MADNKNSNKMHDLSEKIASEEGLKVEEIEKDISKQMGHPQSTRASDLSHRVAHDVGVSPKEINRDLAEQMGRDRTPVTETKSHNVWLYVGIIAALALAAWWIFSKYF